MKTSCLQSIDRSLMTMELSNWTFIPIFAKMAWYFKESMISLIQSRFPLSAMAKHLHNKTGPPPYLTNMVFSFSAHKLWLFCRHTADPNGPKSLVVLHHKTSFQNCIGLSKFILAYTLRHFMFFLVKSVIRQRVVPWRILVIPKQLTMLQVKS